MYTYTHISRLSYAQLYLRTWAPAHAGAHTSAHTHASAHRRRRRAQRPAPHRRPAECVPPAVARRPGRKGGAYLVHVRHRRGVPRADVRVERRRRDERLRAEPPVVDADGTRSHVPARMRGRPTRASSAPARDRTRMQDHTRVPIYTPGLCIDICTYILYMTCALAIYRRTDPRMRT